jgi:hypothetical protein
MPRPTAVYVCLGILVCTQALSAGEGRKGIITKPKLDRAAPKVELFAAIEAGQLSARMIPHDETRGAIFIENHSDQPLTVALPEAFVGVQVLPQFGLNQNSVGLNIPVSSTFGQSGRQQGNTGNQPVGGGANSQGTQQNNGNQAPNFFSVPPERIVRVEYSSVCLQHGAPEPNSGNVYRLVQVDKFSSDRRLAKLLSYVGSDQYAANAVQAAAWHLTNQKSWDDLAALKFDRVNAPDEAQFSTADLSDARQLIAAVDAAVAAELPALAEAKPTAAKSR